MHIQAVANGRFHAPPSPRGTAAKLREDAQAVLCEQHRKEMLRACETIANDHGLVVKASAPQEVNLRKPLNGSRPLTV